MRACLPRLCPGLPASQMGPLAQWGIEGAHFCLEVGCHQGVESRVLTCSVWEHVHSLYHWQPKKYKIMISLAAQTCGYTVTAQLWLHSWPALRVLGNRVHGGELQPSKKCIISLIFSRHQTFVNAVSTPLNGLSGENTAMSIAPRLFFIRILYYLP